MRAQKTRSHARACVCVWGGRYELGTLSHTENNSNLYSGRSNEFESYINVSVLIHRMHECEFCRCQARVRGSGHASPGFIEKSAHFGAFWHTFKQFNSLSESFIFSTGKVINFEMNE